MAYSTPKEWNQRLKKINKQLASLSWQTNTIGGSMPAVKFRPTKNGAKIPTKATKGAACYDAYLPETYPPLDPGEIRIVNLGFQVEVPYGYELQVRSRSGLASRGIMVANGVGCIDSDWRGDCGVILANMSRAIQPLNAGDRICQLKLSQTYEVLWEVVDVVTETDRGEGGFGSTGGVSEQVQS